jgi:ribosomal protein L37AE/L43A
MQKLDTCEDCGRVYDTFANPLGCPRCRARSSDDDPDGHGDGTVTTEMVETRTTPLVTDGGRISVCPECDSAQIRHQARSHNSCQNCGARFEEPSQRPADHPAGGDNRSGLAKRLVDAEANVLPRGSQPEGSR